MFFFFKQKTAYEMRISDCSSDVCSSDLCGQYTTVPLDRRSALFRAQPVGEALAQLRALGRDDREAIGAALSFAVPIGLVMILGGIPVRGRLARGDRKSVGLGKSGSVRLGPGCPRFIKKKNT